MGKRKNTFSEMNVRRNARKVPASAPPTTIADDNDKFSCSLCDIVIDDEKEIQCKTCHCYFSHICANISDDVFEVLHPILPSVSWVCQECMDIISLKRKSIHTVSRLKEGYEELKKMMADLNGVQLSGSVDVVAGGASLPGLSSNTSNISRHL